jgi:hypothetical protein
MAQPPAPRQAAINDNVDINFRMKLANFRFKTYA